MTLEELNNAFQKETNEISNQLEVSRSKIKDLELGIREDDLAIERHKISGKYQEARQNLDKSLNDLENRIKVKASSFFSLGGAIDADAERKKINTGYEEEIKRILSSDQKLKELEQKLKDKKSLLAETIKTHLIKLQKMHENFLNFHLKRLELLIKSGEYDESALQGLKTKVNGLLETAKNKWVEPDASNVNYQLITKKTNELIEAIISLSKEEREALGEQAIGSLLSKFDEKLPFASPMGKEPKTQSNFYKEKVDIAHADAAKNAENAQEKLKMKEEELASVKRVHESDQKTIQLLRRDQEEQIKVIENLQSTQLKLLEAVQQLQTVVYNKQIEMPPTVNNTKLLTFSTTLTSSVNPSVLSATSSNQVPPTNVGHKLKLGGSEND